MKYKVGDRVRMIRDVVSAKEGYDGIIKAVHNGYYSVEFPCFDSLEGHDCDGEVKSNKGHFISEENIALLDQSLTFQQKLDRFMKEPIGFLVKSKEIADELVKVFEREGMKPLSGGSTKEFMTIALSNAKGYPGDAYVCYNVEGYEGNLMRGTSDFISEDERELLDVTLDELKEYLEPSPMKITIETDGYHKTTAECNGITAESLCNSTDEFDLPKGVHMAVQRLLEKLKEDTGLHVGDIVEVLATNTPFLRESVGLQGKVVRYDKRDDTYLTTLPINFGGDDNWWFHRSELKLIRRGNN